VTGPVIVSAARTAIGTARKGSLAQTTGEELAAAVLTETVRRSGLEPRRFDDVIFAESLYGGGDLARHAAVAAGLPELPGVALNRHCAGSLTSIGMAARGRGDQCRARRGRGARADGEDPGLGGGWRGPSADGLRRPARGW
jgi:acetyl-CoA acetyltransferase